MNTMLKFKNIDCGLTSIKDHVDQICAQCYQRRPNSFFRMNMRYGSLSPYCDICHNKHILKVQTYKCRIDKKRANEVRSGRTNNVSRTLGENESCNMRENTLLS